MDKVRVAAAQFGVGTDLGENLATCLRVIDEAARHGPDLLVLPEFCNHLAWYESPAHAYEVSLELGGAWLAAIGAKAKERGLRQNLRHGAARKWFGDGLQSALRAGRRVAWRDR